MSLITENNRQYYAGSQGFIGDSSATVTTAYILAVAAVMIMVERE